MLFGLIVCSLMGRGCIFIRLGPERKTAWILNLNSGINCKFLIDRCIYFNRPELLKREEVYSRFQKRPPNFYKLLIKFWRFLKQMQTLHRVCMRSWGFKHHLGVFFLRRYRKACCLSLRTLDVSFLIPKPTLKWKDFRSIS